MKPTKKKRKAIAHTNALKAKKDRKGNATDVHMSKAEIKAAKRMRNKLWMVADRLAKQTAEQFPAYHLWFWIGLAGVTRTVAKKRVRATSQLWVSDNEPTK
jgi:hypothetical protein